MIAAPRKLPAPWVLRTFVVLILLLVWEIAGRHGSQLLFSPLSKVLTSGLQIFAEAEVLEALKTTAWILVVGFVLSVAIGLVLGLTVSMSRFTYQTFLPVLLLLYAIPQITVLPLFVLYFGSGPASKVAFGVSHGMFPIAVSVIAGVQGIKPLLVTSAISMGASRWQIFRRITLPYLTPSLFTGMRLASTATLLGVLLAELYVSAGGIGHLTRRFGENFQPDKLYALIAALSLMAILINETMRMLERRYSRWL
ncbi:MAG: ABC transporter permease [Beijerinckiaceae bacterium]|nr:ABC transporter permease [Beijerinckiaceae bacterium]